MSEPPAKLSTMHPTKRARIGGRDWSGLSLDPHTGRLWCVRNSSCQLAELDSEGRVLRTVQLEGFEDVEDLAFVAASEEALSLFLVEERRARLHFVGVPRASKRVKVGSGQTWLLPRAGNAGPEGVAYDAARDRVLVAYEKPPRLLVFAREALMRQTAAPSEGLYWLSLPHIRDVSAVTCRGERTFVLSHESRCVVEIDAHGGEVARLDVGMSQAEGLAFDGAGRLWVVGEPDEVVMFEERPPAAMDLLPPRQSPVDAGFGTGLVRELFEAFDTPSAERHYDWIDPLDGLTFWCGHWHQGRGHKVFSALHQAGLWPVLAQQAKFLSSVRDISVLRDKAWWRGQTKAFDVLWLRKLLVLAGRDPRIAAWQLEFWAQDVVAPALEVARDCGVDTLGGIASLVSMGSSASKWPKAFARDVKGCAFGPDELALAAWQWYGARQGKVRSRMRAIWERYYARTWGPLPSGSSSDVRNWTQRPQHTGVAMVRADACEVQALLKA